jgi:hypothetical protein
MGDGVYIEPGERIDNHDSALLIYCYYIAKNEEIYTVLCINSEAGFPLPASFIEKLKLYYTKTIMPI